MSDLAIVRKEMRRLQRRIPGLVMKIRKLAGGTHDLHYANVEKLERLDRLAEDLSYTCNEMLVHKLREMDLEKGNQ